MSHPVATPLLAVCALAGACYPVPDGAPQTRDAAVAADATQSHRDARGGSADATRHEASEASEASETADGTTDGGHASTGDARRDGPRPVDSSTDSVRDARHDASDGGRVRVFSMEAGTTWTSLYRDYFGPAGVASCAGDGQCHGATSQFGYLASGYLCPAGDAQAGCYAGTTARGDGSANLILPGVPLARDLLGEILCKTQGGGSMPVGCTYVFQPVDLSRIGDWVEAGAPNN